MFRMPQSWNVGVSLDLGGLDDWELPVGVGVLVDVVVMMGTPVAVVVTPAGLVFRRTFFVFGNLLSFFHFMRRFWNQILIWRSDKQRLWAISIRRRRVK